VQQSRGTFRDEISLSIDEKRFVIAEKLAVFPCSLHLSYLLFERHTRKQVGEPVLDGQLSIAIRGYDLGACRGGPDESKGEGTREQRQNKACFAGRFHRNLAFFHEFVSEHACATIAPLTFTLKLSVGGRRLPWIRVGTNKGSERISAKQKYGRLINGLST
jgi:hypothetical protein